MTPLGVFMDLAADKVLVAGVLVAMVEASLVPAWIAAAILIREFVVQAVRQLAAAEDVVISARALGKAKTLATNAGIALLLFGADAATGGPIAATGTREALTLLGLWVLVRGDGAQHRLRLPVHRRRLADPLSAPAPRTEEAATRLRLLDESLLHLAHRDHMEARRRRPVEEVPRCARPMIPVRAHGSG